MFRLIFIISAITFIKAVDGGLMGQFPDFSRERKTGKFFHKELKFENKLRESESEHTVCRTEECFRVAAELWQSVNKSVDPCENFYDYACGRWTINNPIPPTEMSWDSVSKIQKKIQKRIRDLLEESIRPEDILPVKQSKKFYRSCMNVDALETMGVKRLQAILLRNGGWPIAMEFEEWDPKEFTWQLIEKYYLKFIGSSAMLSIQIEPDTREIDFSNFIDESRNEDVKMMLALGTPNLPNVIMPGKRFNRTSLYETGHYAKLITEVALIFAKERDTIVDEEQLATDVQDLINFEKRIRNEFENAKYSSEIVTLEKMQTILNDIALKSDTSKIDLKSFIIDYFADVNVEMNEDEEIRIPSLKLLKNMTKILDETKPRIIVNYIHWHFLSQFLSYTTEQMRKLKYDLQKAITEVKEEIPRSEMCVEAMQMHHAVSYLFVRKYFKNNMKEHAEKMIDKVQKVMVKHILKADWLDNEMRKLQIQKINNMRREIGFPSWYNNASVMESYYRGLVVGNQFLENIFSLKIFSERKSLRSLRNRVRDDMFSFNDPTMVNAFFDYYINTLTVPAGEFQTTFYSPTLPLIMSYGSIGFTMGHEISHSVDINGFTFDENGKEINSFEDAKYEYKRRANCFISQYDDFYEKNNDDDDDNDSSESFWSLVWDVVTFSATKETAGERTQAENIADSMGIEMVFEALQEIENEKNSPRFPGFEDLNNEQFFFLSYANVWCESSTSKYEDLMRNYDSHGKASYRVIGAVQNSEEFAKAFKCPKGSPMNPEQKCKIW